MSTTGLDLRLERVAARVKMLDLAKAMHRHRSTVARYEELAFVDDATAKVYRDALATFSEVATEEVA